MFGLGKSIGSGSSMLGIGKMLENTFKYSNTGKGMIPRAIRHTTGSLGPFGITVGAFGAAAGMVRGLGRGLDNLASAALNYIPPTTGGRMFGMDSAVNPMKATKIAMSTMNLGRRKLL